MAEDRLEIKFVAQTAELESGIAAAVNALTTGLSLMTQSVGSFQAQIGAISGTISRAFGAFAPIVALGIETFAESISRVVNLGDELNKASRKIGIAVEDLSRLRFAADLSGVGFGHLRSGLTQLSHAMAEARNGTGGAGDALRILGIQIEQSPGKLRPTIDVFLDLADKMSKMEDGTGKANLANRIFGRSWEDLMPILNLGRERLRETFDQSDRLGKTMKKETAEAAAQLKEDMRRLNVALGGLWDEIAAKSIPILRKLAENFVLAINPDIVPVAALESKLKQINIAIGHTRDMIKARDNNFFGLFKPNAPDRLDENLARLISERDKIQQKLDELIAKSRKEEEKESAPAIETFENLKTAFHDALVARRQFLQDSTQDEIRYWKNILETRAAGADVAKAITNRLYELEKKAAADSLQFQIGELRAQQDAARDNWSARFRLQDEVITKIAAAEGKLSHEYQAALRERQRMTFEYYAELRSLALAEIDHQKSLEKIKFDLARENLRFQKEIGQINETEQIQRLQEIEQREFQSALRALQNKRTLAGTTIQQKKELDRQIEELEKNHDLRIQKSQNDLALSIKNRWLGVLGTIGSAVSSSITGLIQGFQTFRQALSNIFGAILGAFINLLVEMGVRWLAKEIGLTAITTAATVERQVVDAESAATSIAFATTAAISEIKAYAAAGAAAAMASAAAIPVYGWEIAPFVGAEHYALAMGYGATLAIPAAERGFDVPADTLAYIHKDEMVLPANLAQGVRDMVAGGRAGGAASGPVINRVVINATDADSFRRLLRRNPNAIADALRTAHRNFTPVPA